MANSQFGDTNLILEAFNCANHGHIQKFENWTATFGSPELLPDMIESIHLPINQSIALKVHYRDLLRHELANKSEQDLLRVFGDMALRISNQEQLRLRLQLFLEKENQYLGEL